MRTVLVVDDNDAHRYAMALTVEKLGFRVLTASAGNEVLELARKEKPDVVLLDIHLPELTGYDICRLLKADTSTARIAVVFHTASDMSSASGYALELGADAFLTYPINESQLKAVIEGALAKQAGASGPRS